MHACLHACMPACLPACLCWVFVSVRGLSLVVASGGHSSSRWAGLSLSRPLLLWSTGSRRAGSVIVAHGPSRSAACEIFPDQGSKPCPLHWQADSQPLRHQGSPAGGFLTTAPPGKSQHFEFWLHVRLVFSKSLELKKKLSMENAILGLPFGDSLRWLVWGFFPLISLISSWSLVSLFCSFYSFPV